jgi:hypothetical protein
MKNKLIALICATIGFIPMAQSQAAESVLRVSARYPALRVEYGKVFYTAEIPQLNYSVEVWTGVGAELTNGNMLGSFSLLFPIYKSNFVVKGGLDYIAIAGEKPKFDLSLNFSIGQNQTVSASLNRVMYAVRF